jgi:diguanylate cyclase (GGDEF)-like protein/PAS domain S-box-containing protein
MQNSKVNEELALSVLEAAPEAIIAVDRDGRIVGANSLASACFDYPLSEMIGKEVEDLIPHSFRKTHTVHRKKFSSSPKLRPMGQHLKLFGLKKCGEEFPADIGLSPIRTENRELIIAVIRDRTGIESKLANAEVDLESAIQERTASLEKANAQLLEEIQRRKKAESRLRQEATHNGLTGAGNLRYFREQADCLMAYAARYHKEFALLFIDLDCFKQVNDTCGHQTGDRLLTGLTRSIKRQLRKNDSLFRLGGDEFAILIPELTSRNGYREVAQRLLRLVRTYCVGRGFSVTASVGIAIYPANGQDLVEMTRAADRAMFEAKKAGGDSFRFAEEMRVEGR